DRYPGREHELPGQAPDLAPADNALTLHRVLGGYRLRHVEARLLDCPLEVLSRRRPGDVIHRDGLGRLVRRRAEDSLEPAERLLAGCDAGRVVQLLDAEADAGLAAIVSRRADRPDQLGDVGLRVVVAHG